MPSHPIDAMPRDSKPLAFKCAYAKAAIDEAQQGTRAQTP